MNTQGITSIQHRFHSPASLILKLKGRRAAQVRPLCAIYCIHVHKSSYMLTVIEGMAKIGLRYGATWLQEALADSFETGQTQDPRQELRRYLQAPLSKNVDDVVQWWDVSSS